MPIKRPTSLEAYADLIEQAIFETDELRSIAEYDEDEGMSAALDFIGDLDAQLKQLKDQVNSGDYSFSDEDLPLMQIVNASSTFVLPFRTLLKQINETHRKGLRDPNEDDE